MAVHHTFIIAAPRLYFLCATILYQYLFLSFFFFRFIRLISFPASTPHHLLSHEIYRHVTSWVPSAEQESSQLWIRLRNLNAPRLLSHLIWMKDMSNSSIVSTYPLPSWLLFSFPTSTCSCLQQTHSSWRLRTIAFFQWRMWENKKENSIFSRSNIHTWNMNSSNMEWG